MIRVIISIAGFVVYSQAPWAAEPQKRAGLSTLSSLKSSAVAVPLTADERKTAEALPRSRMIALEIGANTEVMRVVSTQNLQVFIPKSKSPKSAIPADASEETGSSKPNFVRITDASQVGGKITDQYIKVIVDRKIMWLHDTGNPLKGEEKRRRLVFMGALIADEEFQSRFPLRHVKYTPPSPAQIAERQQRQRDTAEAELNREAAE